MAYAMYCWAAVQWTPDKLLGPHASTALAPFSIWEHDLLGTWLSPGSTPQNGVQDHIKAWRVSFLGVGWGESLDILI